MAAVHALFLGQNPQNLKFERFLYFYMAIEACYALAEELAEGLDPPPSRPTHTDRIKWMCNQFSIGTPAWAEASGKDKSAVVVIRNNTLHEALFMDAPLGFAVHKEGSNQNLTLEMSALVCRLLVALIAGDGADYVQSPVNTRQIHGLDLS